MKYGNSRKTPGNCDVIFCRITDRIQKFFKTRVNAINLFRVIIKIFILQVKHYLELITLEKKACKGIDKKHSKYSYG